MVHNQNSDQDVTRLKELLFGQEKRVLSDIEQLVLKHEGRIGDDEAMQHTVAAIIADALREAEVNNHRELAEAISPVVVLGIKREIKNSRDEMVDAFYPILGRLVSAYVANAFRDFIEETNRRLEGSLTGRFIRLRLKSLFTRTPYHQLVLREARRLRIEELFLIKTGSGILVDHWRADPSGKAENRERDQQLLSSLLTAVTEFANEAFADGSQELRAMDIGPSRIFLRASNTCLLVVKSSGYSGRRLERLLDREMISVLESYGDAIDKSDSFEARKSLKAILPTLAEQLNTLLARHKSPPVLAYSFLTIVLIASLSAAGWYYRDGLLTEGVREKIVNVIQGYRELEGFPIQVSVSPDRSRAVIAGLSPDMKANSQMIAEVEKLVKPITVETRFSYVPTLQSVSDENRKISDDLVQLRKTLVNIENDLKTTATAGALRTASERLEQMAEKIKTLDNTVALSSDLAKVGTQVDELVSRWDHPRRKVREWAGSHAIFFGEEDTLRDPEMTSKLLKEFSEILMASNARIRVIGYTDPTGTPHGNVSLGIKRAKKIASELKTYGVPESRLKIIGRANGLLLSFDKGPNSSNRRVEFELIYEEETVETTGVPLEIRSDEPAEDNSKQK